MRLYRLRVLSTVVPHGLRDFGEEHVVLEGTSLDNENHWSSLRFVDE
jgi:hypothetical protein